jgi:hypothetical protein
MTHRFSWGTWAIIILVCTHTILGAGWWADRNDLQNHINNWKTEAKKEAAGADKMAQELKELQEENEQQSDWEMEARRQESIAFLMVRRLKLMQQENEELKWKLMPDDEHPVAAPVPK